ncbi:hypothetical protein Tco_0470677 [Tanacetum coccineum]
MAPLPAADQIHQWLRYQIQEYTEEFRRSYEQRLKTIWSRPVNRVHVLDFEGLAPKMRQDLGVRLRMVYSGEGQQDEQYKDRIGWLHMEQEMAEAGFGAYWDGNVLFPAPSNVLIRDPMRRLCHRMIAYSISGRVQAPEKVTGVLISSTSAAWTVGLLTLLSDEGLRGLQAAMAGAHKADEAGPAAEEDTQEILVPAPAPALPPPPPAPQH